jgi:AI-2 transport protein TqsA
MVLAAVAVAVALIYTRAVMIPFVLAIFISYLVSPLVDFLQLRLRAPRWTSIVAALFVVVGLMTLLGLLITVSTRGLIESAPIYRERLAHLAQTGFSLLGRYNIDLGQQTVLEAVRQLPILSFLRGTAGTVLGLLSNGFLVLIFVIYLLAGRNPNELRQGMYAQIDKLIRHYIVTKVTTSAATGILVGVALALFGLDLALVFGVLAFLLNFIPNVGSVAATLLPVPLALVQFDSWWAIGGVIIVPAIIQNVIGNGIEPRMMGEGLELHPVTILLALVFWGLLWGAVGMLLAAPMTAVLRIVLGEFETTRPLAELLAGRLPPVVPSPEASRE